MSWSYNPLWIMLIKKDIKRTELKKLAGLNSSAIAKMGRKEPVAMDNLEKLCKYFHCRIEDIVEYVPDEEPLDDKE